MFSWSARPVAGCIPYLCIAPAAVDALAATARGAFAREVTGLHPRLPVEENGRLFEAAIRESFLARVFAYAHWQRLCGGGPDSGAPHGISQPLQVSAHGPQRPALPSGRPAVWARRVRDGWQSEPGTTPSGGEATGVAGTAGRYLDCLMEGLGKPATRGGHANALSHLQGYLSHEVDGSARRSLARAIETYRTGGVPFAEPHSLLLRRLEDDPDPYLVNQVYLQAPWTAGVRPG